MSSNTAGMVKLARALSFRCLELWMWAALGILEEMYKLHNSKGCVACRVRSMVDQ